MEKQKISAQNSLFFQVAQVLDTNIMLNPVNRNNRELVRDAEMLKQKLETQDLSDKEVAECEKFFTEKIFRNLSEC
jgi:hypothetical protein